MTQTYQNIEIILVDDGSPDNCGDICDEYAKKDIRIKVIHQPNQGVSVARNNGIDICRGSYLMFVDADDWIENDCVEVTVKEILSQKVECLFFDHVSEYEHGQIVQGGASRRYSKDDVRSLSDYIISAQNTTDFNLFTPWGYVINTELIKERQVRFPEGVRLSEDLYFNLCLFEYLDSAYYLDYAGYHYRIHSQSASHSEITAQFALDEITLFDRFLERYHPNDERRCEMLGYHAILIFGTVQVKYVNNPSFHLSRKERIQNISDYFSNPIIARYISYVKMENLNSRKLKLKLFLIKNKYYGIYDLFGNLISWKYRRRELC